MIDSIDENGIINWTCTGEECQSQLSAHITELEYVNHRDGPHGATIALPPCKGCTTQCFLKADYSLKELFKLTHTVVDNLGNIKGYALPLRHVRNLITHHFLYKEGKASHPPVLPLPGHGFLEHSSMGALKEASDVAYSLWFAWAMMRERGQMIQGFDQFFLGISEPVPTITGPKEVS
jgi:hypothetical protein